MNGERLLRSTAGNRQRQAYRSSGFSVLRNLGRVGAEAMEGFVFRWRSPPEGYLVGPRGPPPSPMPLPSSLNVGDDPYPGACTRRSPRGGSLTTSTGTGNVTVCNSSWAPASKTLGNSLLSCNTPSKVSSLCLSSTAVRSRAPLVDPGCREHTTNLLLASHDQPRPPVLLDARLSHLVTLPLRVPVRRRHIANPLPVADYIIYSPSKMLCLKFGAKKLDIIYN